MKTINKRKFIISANVCFNICPLIILLYKLCVYRAKLFVIYLIYIIICVFYFLFSSFCHMGAAHS